MDAMDTTIGWRATPKARRRLRALPPPEDEAREIDVDVIPTPRQALAVLEQVKEPSRAVHDADNEQHRSVCRLCRVVLARPRLDCQRRLRGDCESRATPDQPRAPEVRAMRQESQRLRDP